MLDQAESSLFLQNVSSSQFGQHIGSSFCSVSWKTLFLDETKTSYVFYSLLYSVCSLLQKHDISRATKTHVDVHFTYLAQPLPLSALSSPKCVSLMHLTTHRPSYTYQSWPIIHTQHWQNLYCNYGFYILFILGKQDKVQAPRSLARMRKGTISCFW